MTTQEFKSIKDNSAKLTQKGSKIKKFYRGDINYYATLDTMGYLRDLKNLEEDRDFLTWELNNQRDYEQFLKTLSEELDDFGKFEQALNSIYLPLKKYAYLCLSSHGKDWCFKFQPWKSIEEIGEYFNLAGAEFEDDNGERINYGDGEKYRKACWDLGKIQIEEVGGIILFPNIGSLVIY